MNTLGRAAAGVDALAMVVVAARRSCWCPHAGVLRWWTEVHELPQPWPWLACLPRSLSLSPLCLALFCLSPALLCVLYSVHSSRRSRKTKSFAFSNPYLKGNLFPDREHHGVILFVGFWCGLYIILVAAASLMSLGPDNPSHDLLHMCRRFFAILSLSLQFQFCIIVISSLQNVSSSLSSLVVCFLKNSFMSARLTCSSCSSSWILCVLHLCCGVYITNPGKNFISLFENRS
jgi:hypothetical protein